MTQTFQLPFQLPNLTDLPHLQLPQFPGLTWAPMPTPSGTSPTAIPPIQLPQGAVLPQFTLPQGGGLPDLSALLPVLTPIISAVAPQLAPFLPIIGVLLQILHSLSTQNTAAVASGTPNPALQLVHDAAWQQALSIFAPKQAAPSAVPAAA